MARGEPAVTEMLTTSRQPLVRQQSDSARQVLSRQESGSSRGVPDPSLDTIHPPDRSSPYTSDIEHGVTSGSVTPTGTDSPSNQVSPPPSYHDIPGTVPAHQGVSRGPPPSYEEAVDPNGKYSTSTDTKMANIFVAEPPSYDSLFGRIRDTHKASRNVIDFVVKVILLLLGTIGCTIACSITVVIPVCMIVIGSVYFHDCPAEPYVPIFLIVGGEQPGILLEDCLDYFPQYSLHIYYPIVTWTVINKVTPVPGSFSVFKYLIGVLSRVRRAETGSEQDPQPTHPVQSLITFFLCGWFITGCVWVYRSVPCPPHKTSD